MFLNDDDFCNIDAICLIGCCVPMLHVLVLQTHRQNISVRQSLRLKLTRNGCRDGGRGYVVKIEQIGSLITRQTNESDPDRRSFSQKVFGRMSGVIGSSRRGLRHGRSLRRHDLYEISANGGEEKPISRERKARP